jgi:hypothetical protein
VTARQGSAGLPRSLRRRSVCPEDAGVGAAPRSVEQQIAERNPKSSLNTTLVVLGGLGLDISGEAAT